MSRSGVWVDGFHGAFLGEVESDEKEFSLELDHF